MSYVGKDKDDKTKQLELRIATLENELRDARSPVQANESYQNKQPAKQEYLGDIIQGMTMMYAMAAKAYTAMALAAREIKGIYQSMGMTPAYAGAQMEPKGYNKQQVNYNGRR